MPERPAPIRRENVNFERQTWRALRLSFFYRLTLALSVGIAYFTGSGPSLLGRSFPDLFSTTIVVYLGFVVSSGLLLYWRTHPAEQQVQFSLLIDILAITLLMHASGGISSGLGLLMAISIANGSLLMGGRLALLYAALASLAVLTEQV